MATSTPPDSTSPPAHIAGVLVVGGGYAGLHAARAVEQAGHPVTVLDRDSTHDFVTRLAAVAAGNASASRAAHALDGFQPRTEIGSLSQIGDGTVTLDDGRVLTADAVIVSAGARPTQPPIDGIERALTLRSADDALAIRTALDTATSLVVIGGGATGVQLAAAVAHRHPNMSVHLVEAGPRLLGPMGAATGAGARRILESRGASVHLDTDVERITPTGVDIGQDSNGDTDGDSEGEASEGEADGGPAGGRHIAGLVVWAGGFEARADELGVDVTGDGRILVDDDLRIVGMDKSFAAGDIAAHLDDDGTFLPMSAQIATQAGTAAGRNAACLLAGTAMQQPKLVQRGWVLDLGGRRGLAEFGPIALTVPFADLVPPILHDLIDLKTSFGMGGLQALRW